MPEKKCARKDCTEAEFRIDGYCSIYCRDVDEADDEHAAELATVNARIAELERERDAWKALAHDSVDTCFAHEHARANMTAADCRECEHAERYHALAATPSPPNEESTE